MQPGIHLFTLASFFVSILLACGGSVEKPPPNPAKSEPEPIPPSKDTAPLKALTDAEAKTLVGPYLDDKTHIAHTVFRGGVGPSQDTVVAFTTSKMTFSGLTISDGKVYPIPLLSSSWSAETIEAVTFVDLNNDGARDVLVMATYITGIGPDGIIPFNHNAAFTWDGLAWAHLKIDDKARLMHKAEDVIRHVRDK